MHKRSRYGNSLKDFKLEDEIGHGGFAKVFKAKCMEPGFCGMYVAIKRIEKKTKILDKVKTEIEIHSSLPTGNRAIVEFYASFEDENYWYLVMELCTGGSLEKYLKRTGPLFEKEAVLLIKQVIQGVSSLHENHILHRDLSLRNLLLTDSKEEIKIADFGLAVKLDKKNEKVNTKVGTANFMAPEVVKRDSYSYEADYWSVGCILYALLCGSLPFNAKTKEKIQRNIQYSDLMFPDNINISTEAKEFLKSLLKKDPKDRISFPRDALNHPLFQKHENISISQISYHENSDDSSMSSSAKFQLTHTASNGPDQYKSQNKKKSKSVKRSNMTRSHDNLSDNIRFGYESHQVISQSHKFCHAPLQDRNSEENKAYMDERNTFVKGIMPSLNAARKSSHQKETGNKDLIVKSQRSNDDSGVNSSSKSQSAYASSNGSNQHRSLKNNNVTGSHDALFDNARVCYQSHQEFFQKQRFDHALYQDRNSEENKTYLDERNTFLMGIMHPLNTERKSSYRKQLETNDSIATFQKCNGDSGVNSSSKFQSAYTSSNGSHRHRSLRNNNVDSSHDNLSHNTRFGYQSHQEFPQKQRFDDAPYQERQIKENKNYVNQSLKAMIDPLNTARIGPRRMEIKKFVISVLRDGEVCLECLINKKGKKYVVLFYLISADGLKINVYKPKKKIPLKPDQPPPFSQKKNEIQYFNFENLPKLQGEMFHWRNYYFAKQYIDLFRGTTPKITIYGQFAVIKMMENTPPNYVMKFYKGKYEGYEISEKNHKLTIKDGKKCVIENYCNSSMLEEFNKMKERCTILEKNIESYHDSNFPLVLGKKRDLSKGTLIPDNDKENSPPTFLQSASVNGLDSGVPTHIITTSPEISFTPNTLQRSPSISYSALKSTSPSNNNSYKSITDIIPDVKNLKIEDEWYIAEYIDNIQMWLSKQNDYVLFKPTNGPMIISMKDNPTLENRFHNDSRKILRFAMRKEQNVT